MAEVLKMDEVVKVNTELMDQITTQQEEISGVLEEVSAHADARPNKLERLRDKYPKLGPVLVRMIPHFCDDLEDMLETFPGLKSLVTEDMEHKINNYMAQIPPSQDVNIWKVKLDEAKKQDQQSLGKARTQTQQQKEQTADYRAKLATAKTELRKSKAEMADISTLTEKSDGLSNEVLVKTHSLDTQTESPKTFELSLTQQRNRSLVYKTKPLF